MKKRGETVGKVLGLTDEEIAEISAMRQDTEEARVHEKMNEDENLPPVTKGFDNKVVNLLLEHSPRPF